MATAFDGMIVFRLRAMCLLASAFDGVILFSSPACSDIGVVSRQNASVAHASPTTSSHSGDSIFVFLLSMVASVVTTACAAAMLISCERHVLRATAVFTSARIRIAFEVSS